MQTFWYLYSIIHSTPKLFTKKYPYPPEIHSISISIRVTHSMKGSSWEDQTLEETSPQSCIRATAARFKTGAEARPRHATSGRACAGGGGPPPVYSRPADKQRGRWRVTDTPEGPAKTLLITWRHLTALGNLLNDWSDDSSIFKSANEIEIKWVRNKAASPFDHECLASTPLPSIACTASSIYSRLMGLRGAKMGGGRGSRVGKSQAGQL